MIFQLFGGVSDTGDELAYREELKGWIKILRK
jgi:hypothetical protein